MNGLFHSAIFVPSRWVSSQVLQPLADEGWTEERRSQRAENRPGDNNGGAQMCLLLPGGVFVSAWICEFSCQEPRGNI